MQQVAAIARSSSPRCGSAAELAEILHRPAEKTTAQMP
jgi:hypothetical protein